MHAGCRNGYFGKRRYLIDFRSVYAKCQVTKGALVWSWHNICSFYQLPVSVWPWRGAILGELDAAVVLFFWNLADFS
jgi:hypothetical protein